MIKKRKIPDAEIPTASQADLAFLLLLFFLVSTVIDVDTGLGLTLPEYVPPDQQVEVKVDPSRMAAVLVNENGEVLVDNNIEPVFRIKDILKPRIESKINLPLNKKMIVSLKTDRKTVYNVYIAALDQIKQAFFEVRDEYSNGKFGRKFNDLNQEQQEDVKNAVPIIISLAEPELIKK
ncbi:MAG TPA: biopolymer transporter ExbD [Ignavibacteriaceae bacterium]|jgi:biopolymer transport protein ExbD|nr:MAG: Biopolymer transport protein ExbD/TolR [Ignavibacteria bacterium ADurb.Bin266]OQY71027.1 MAG: biopolymer transporter ExbD [Ignavibacteriales bacterium UTCHB2]HQF42931.1 biopolymer transporter ExbD [Ignavibacteriaceae bacterium]HQI41951.1 biopolymer transporter ExbD [Ignavibacteriaceae bacterium]HQJ45777.1 biopolymer transporter ExbD [Ignavibacteriaceae bacterium]